MECVAANLPMTIKWTTLVLILVLMECVAAFKTDNYTHTINRS